MLIFSMNHEIIQFKLDYIYFNPGNEIICVIIIIHYKIYSIKF